MNLFFNTSALLKSGLAVAAIAVAVINFSQTNNYAKIAGAISNANAAPLGCITAQNQVCSGYSTDGLFWSVSNAENM
jgi:hypothetical protein